MADTTIPTNPGNGGPSLDAESVTRTDGSVVVRERDRIAGELATELADVRRQPPSAEDYGIVARLAGPVDLNAGQFEAITAGQARIIALLEQIVERI